MLRLNHDRIYNGIYQENIIFEENFQDFVDQEEWDDNSDLPEIASHAFILPGQDDAEA